MDDEFDFDDLPQPQPDDLPTEPWLGLSGDDAVSDQETRMVARPKDGWLDLSVFRPRPYVTEFDAALSPDATFAMPPRVDTETPPRTEQLPYTSSQQQGEQLFTYDELVMRSRPHADAAGKLRVELESSRETTQAEARQSFQALAQSFTKLVDKRYELDQFNAMCREANLRAAYGKH